MNMQGRHWLVIALIGAVLAIGADLAGVWPLYAAAKPATTMAIGVFAWQRLGDDAMRRRWILAGLVLSLVGDVALMWPKEGFIPGLVAFLVAHLAYIVAFTRGVGFARFKLSFVAYGVIAAAVLALLWPHIGSALRVPVLAYVVCLACMAAQAAAWWLHARGTPLEPYARSAAIGGAFFMASDASLAINKFMQPLPVAALIVLATYWLAQAFIASSLVERRGNG